VGSHACKALAAGGYVPVTYDSMEFGHEWAVKWGPLERGDILDSQRLQDVMSRHRPMAVLHFAGYAFVGESVENPGRYYRNNVAGTVNVLNAMASASVKHMVFSSTCSTYGVPQTETISESHPQNPVNPYGASKLMVERMLADYDLAHGIRYVSLRYFNAAGADPDCEIGEDHDPETHLIPLVLMAALGRRHSISIFGDDYPTPDGTCIRDYVHVTDLANAHVRALSILESGHRSASFNLGTGKGASVREVIETARRVTNKPITAELAPRRPGDPPRLVAESALAAKVLGWRARYSDLAEIVGHAWRWASRDNR
jgi:UDP-arabinose 4-epimerase